MTRTLLHQISPAEKIEEAMDVIDRDGALVVTGLLDQATIELLNREVEDLFDQSKFCDGQFFGQKTKRVHSLIAKAIACQKMAAHPFILEIMNKILTPSCEKIQLNLTQGIQICPGEKRQILHRDDSMFPTKIRIGELMANAMWAVSKFTAENGGTVLALGSHKWKKERRPQENELISAEMQPGDVLIYLGSLIHGGGENRSLAPRTGITIGYCLGWLRQYENQYFAAPPEVAKQLPPVLQDLLGYTVHRPNLGMYEGNEPKVLFQSTPRQDYITHDWLTPEQTQLVQSHYSNPQSLSTHANQK